MTTCEIQLSKGYVALVDDSDYEELAHFRWHAVSRKHTTYAQRGARRVDGRHTTLLMHRWLVPGAERVDHINGNGLDNRRANLRAATNAENLRNRRGLEAGNTSGYRGVYWDKRREKWAARIMVDGRGLHLGRFVDPVEAARAFDAIAIELFGEFHGYLNFPDVAGQQTLMRAGP